MDYLIKKDFVRDTRKERLSAEIDWSSAEHVIAERFDDGYMDVEYKAYLVMNNRAVGKIDILLRLIPVEKSDANTDGVGVWAWKDIAENPFEVVEDEG